MPGIGTGVDTRLGFAQETAYGVAVTPNRFLEFSDESLQANVSRRVSRGQARTVRAGRVRTSQIGPTGRINLDAQTNGMLLLYLMTFGRMVHDWPGGTRSQGTLTIAAQPADGETITLDTVVYTFKDALTGAANEILIGADLAATQANVVAAVNLDASTHLLGIGYSSATQEHPTVTAAAFVGNDSVIEAKVPGVAGDTIATTETMADAGNLFDGPTLGTTTAGADGADARHVYTFTPHPLGLRDKSLHVQIQRSQRDGTLQPFNYRGIKVMRAEFGADLDGNLTNGFELDGKEMEEPNTTALATAALTAGRLFDFSDFGVALDATTIKTRSFTASIANELDTDRRFLGSANKDEPRDGEFNVTLGLDPEFESRALLESFLSAGEHAIVVTGQTPFDIPGAAAPYKWELTAAVANLTENATPSTGDTNRVNRQPFQAEVLDNGSDPVIKLVVETDDVGV